MRVVVFGDQVDALLQHVQRYVRLLLADDERRRNTYRVGPATQQQNAALERLLDDQVALHRTRGPRLLVGNDLDTNHQAPSANVAHQVERSEEHTSELQ